MRSLNGAAIPPAPEVIAPDASLLPEWRTLVLSRFALFGVFALFIAFGWSTVSWGLYAVVFGLASVSYGLARCADPARQLWTNRFCLLVDVCVLGLVIRGSGGGASPFAALVYLWLFAVVLLHLRRGQIAPLPLFASVALVVLALSSWGDPHWIAALAAQAGRLALASMLGWAFLRERSRARVDPLTDVLHRSAGVEGLQELIRQDQPFTVAFIDLAGFKGINDNFGHVAGDEVLKAVAGRLSHAVRAGDIVMRYGGDEFVVASKLAALPERLEATLATPLRTSAGTLPVHADVGAVRWRPGDTLETLLSSADAAMYQRKRQRYGERGYAEPVSTPLQQRPAGVA